MTYKKNIYIFNVYISLTIIYTSLIRFWWSCWQNMHLLCFTSIVHLSWTKWL